MCATHWGRVTRATQALVHRRLREWRESPTLETVRAYRDACNAATAEVERYQRSAL
jgi:hypothetical protein